jgi:hypothetical protein
MPARSRRMAIDESGVWFWLITQAACWNSDDADDAETAR